MSRDLRRILGYLEDLEDEEKEAEDSGHPSPESRKA